MKVEKSTAPVERNSSSLADAIRKLKGGERLRLTTAREAMNIAGIRGAVFKKDSGKKIRTCTDGDDVLVFVVNRE